MVENNSIIIAIGKEVPLEEEHLKLGQVEQEDQDLIIELIEIITIIPGMMTPLKDIIPAEVIRKEN